MAHLTITRTAFAAFLLFLGASAPAFADNAPAAMPTKIEVFPPDINLATARDRQLVVVQATYADGLTRDVTAEAVITPADPKLLRRDKNIFWPAADGKTEAGRHLRRPEPPRSPSPSLRPQATPR